MQSIGIDLGAKQSHLVLANDQAPMQTLSLPTATLGAWLRTQPRSRVVMETCTQSRAVARAALAAQHETLVVPSTVVRALGVGRRGIKTDKRDAEVLATAGLRNPDLPSVYLRRPDTEAKRALLSARQALIEGRTRLVLHLKSTLRGRLVVLRATPSAASFATSVRDALLATAEGISVGDEAILAALTAMTAQIEQLDDQLATLVKCDDTCQRMMTMPGIGPVISLALSTHLEDPNRFRSAEALGSYMALVPGESTTGGNIHRTGTLRAGPGHLKSLMIQAAWTMWRSRPGDPVVVWARALADRRGRRIAIVALARKMTIILWAMWKAGRPYQPDKAVCPKESHTPT